MVRMSGEAFGGAAWCGCPESLPRGAAWIRMSREPAGGAALPPRCRLVAAAGRGCIAASQRGVTGEGRMFYVI